MQYSLFIILVAKFVWLLLSWDKSRTSNFNVPYFRTDVQKSRRQLGQFWLPVKTLLYLTFQTILYCLIAIQCHCEWYAQFFQWKSLTGVPYNKNEESVNIVYFADSSDSLSASFTSMMVLPPLQNILLSSRQQVQLLATDVALNWNPAKRTRWCEADVNANMWSLNIASGQSHFKGLKEHDSDSIYMSIWHVEIHVHAMPGTFCNFLGDNWWRRRRVYRQRSRPLLSRLQGNRALIGSSILRKTSTACQHPCKNTEPLDRSFLHCTGEMCDTWTSSSYRHHRDVLATSGTPLELKFWLIL